MLTNKSPRARLLRQKRAAPPPLPPGLPPFATAMAGAYGEASQSIADMKNTLNTATGSMLVNLLLVEGKTLEQAAAIMGISLTKLRADGIDFTMRLSEVIAPDIYAMTTCLAADIEVDVAKAKAFEATAHAPGTMI